MWQDRILSKLMSSLTLARIHDSELKVPADQDALTTAELLDSLTKTIFSETENFKAGEYTDRKPAISSVRRNLQRAYLERLSRLAMGQTTAPEDCETIAFAQLKDLKGRIDTITDRRLQARPLQQGPSGRVVGEDSKGARRDDGRRAVGPFAASRTICHFPFLVQLKQMAALWRHDR